jgi:hypothetical protein
MTVDSNMFSCTFTISFRTEQRISFETSLVHISVPVQILGVCLIITTQIDPKNIPYNFGRNLQEHTVYLSAAFYSTVAVLCLNGPVIPRVWMHIEVTW